VKSIGNKRKEKGKCAIKEDMAYMTLISFLGLALIYINCITKLTMPRDL